MKKYAFTLMEVLLALAILASSVFVLSQLHMRALFRVSFDRDEIEKIFLIKKDLYKFFFKTDRKAWPTEEKPQIHKVESPEMNVLSFARDIHKNSSLKKFKDKIYIVQSVGKWKQGNDPQQIKMLSFVLKPPVKKEKK